eukprot:scaffold69012_cov35-Tisochrysis_lutea.AAC.2
MPQSPAKFGSRCGAKLGDRTRSGAPVTFSSNSHFARQLSAFSPHDASQAVRSSRAESMHHKTGLLNLRRSQTASHQCLPPAWTGTQTNSASATRSMPALSTNFCGSVQRRTR